MQQFIWVLTVCKSICLGVSSLQRVELQANVWNRDGGLKYALTLYYIPITDTTLELSVFWPSGTESRINELRFSESISLSFKTRLTSVTCFCGEVT